MTSNKYNVGGILLNQPFKIRRLGHFGFNVTNLAECTHFYTDLIGFKISDAGAQGGYFMRFGNDHHAFAMFSKKAADERRAQQEASGQPVRRY